MLIQKLRVDGAQLCICQQNVVEFWAVATRPLGANGFAWSISAVEAAVGRLREAFMILAEPPDALDRWLRLCVQRAVSGRQAYDARLIALMEAHGISHLVTLNPIDFKRYHGLVILSPGA